MRRRDKCSILLVGVGLLLAPWSQSRAQGNASHTADSAYIAHAESDWAEAVVKGNRPALDRILADDFIEIGSTGKRYSKADAVDFRAVDLVSNQVDSITIRFYGDVAIAFGSEAWKKKDGSEGRNLWTDTWARRRGKWQIIASAEQALIPAK